MDARLAHGPGRARQLGGGDGTVLVRPQPRLEFGLGHLSVHDRLDDVVRVALLQVRRGVEGEEVAQLLESLGGADGFGVVLDAFDRERLVAQAHDLPVVRHGADLEAVRERGLVDGQGVVAHRLEVLGEALEEAAAVVVDAAGLAVHQALGGNDASAESLRDGLVPEADAEEGDLAGERRDRGEGHAGGIGVAGSGREDQGFRVLRGDPGHVDGVVLGDLDVRAEHGQFLDDVVGEGIVVVYHQNHGSVSKCGQSSPAATEAASKDALDLLTVSWYSLTGSESATMPAPARISRRPFCRNRVRMTMAKFMSPV